MQKKWEVVRNQHDKKKYAISTVCNPLGFWETAVFESAGPFTVFRPRYYTMTVPFETDSPDVVKGPVDLFDLRGDATYTHQRVSAMVRSAEPVTWTSTKEELNRKKTRILGLLDEFRDDNFVGGYRSRESVLPGETRFQASQSGAIAKAASSWERLVSPLVATAASVQMAKNEHFRLDIALEFDFLCIYKVSRQLRKVFGAGRAGLVSELARMTTEATIKNFVTAIGESVEKQSTAIAIERADALTKYRDFSSSMRKAEISLNDPDDSQLLDAFVKRLSSRWQIFEENPAVLQEAAQAAHSLLRKLGIDNTVAKLQTSSGAAAERPMGDGASRATPGEPTLEGSAVARAIGGRVSPCPTCSGPSAMDLKPRDVSTG